MWRKRWKLILTTGAICANWTSAKYDHCFTLVKLTPDCFPDQGCEAGVQDTKGKDERVQQTGRQVLRQHVREMEEAWTAAEGAREAGAATDGHRQCCIRALHLFAMLYYLRDQRRISLAMFIVRPCSLIFFAAATHMYSGACVKYLVVCCCDFIAVWMVIRDCMLYGINL